MLGASKTSFLPSGPDSRYQVNKRYKLHKYI